MKRWLMLSSLLYACGGTPTMNDDPIPDPSSASTPDAPRAACEEAPPATYEDGAPRARRCPVALIAHGDTRVDDYYWLRDDDRSDPGVLAYLEAENAFVESTLEPVAELREELFEEITGRIPSDDASAPVRIDDWLYYRRYEDGADYPVYARRKANPISRGEAAERVLLDGPALAEGHSFWSLGGWEPSPDHATIAFAEDIVSRRQYRLRFQNAETGELYPEIIEGTSGDIAWADPRTVFYIKNNPETLRTETVWRHTLGTDPAEDTLVLTEEDEAFYLGLERSPSGAYILITHWATTTTEVQLVPTAEPSAAPTPLLPRREDHEYSAVHLGDRFFVLSNAGGASNFKLMSAPVATHADPSTWTEVIPHREDVFLHDVAAFDRHLVVNLRRGGIRRVEVMPIGEDGAVDTGAAKEIAFDGAYVAWIGPNANTDASVVRVIMSSLTTPRTDLDVHLDTGERTVMKRQQVVGDFSSEDYRSERFDIEARDGARVPVSIVYHKDTPIDGTAPLYVYGYGSYGASMDPWFSSPRLSLLDRGFVYAVLHVRGGQELGRAWYEDGKLMKKMNTFTDFVDATAALVERGYGAADKVIASGGSAGGLLVGAIANLRPDLYTAVVTRVPFVDVVTTMLDASIPLTTNEYDEWGNPEASAEAYAYMKSYSPYDNVAAVDYPALLITTGLHDSQVQYWEPAKWIAKLRAVTTGDAPLLLHTNMEAGHGGASGRFARHKDTALGYAFILHVLGMTEAAQD